TGAVIERWFTPEFVQKAPTAVERIAAMLKSTPAEGYAGCCGAIRDMDQRESIRSVKGKDVLVIVGTRDPATPPAAGELIQRNIPGAKIARLEAAHLSNVEQPEAFTKTVLEFL